MYKRQAKQQRESEAEAHKDKGNAAWKANNAEEAIHHYTRAIDVGHTSQIHVYYSNRSAAYVSVGNFMAALEDATHSVDINPNWWKGYLRKGTALLVSCFTAFWQTLFEFSFFFAFS